LTLAHPAASPGNYGGIISFGTTAAYTEKRGAEIGSQITASNASTITGDLEFNTNNAGTLSQKMIITGAGNVGIGTPGTGATLDVAGTVRVTGGGVGIGAANAGGAGTLLVTATNGITNSSVGSISNAASLCYDTSSGQFGACSSDERLKTKITTISESGLGIVGKLRSVHYAWRADPKAPRVGFIAQEVMKVVPSAVYTTANGYYGFRSDELMPYAIKAIQELDERNKALQSENKALEARLERLEKALGIAAQ